MSVLLVFGITACNPTAPKYYEVYFETYGYVDVITQNVKENETAIVTTFFLLMHQRILNPVRIRIFFVK